MKTNYFILSAILSLGLVSCNDSVAASDLESAYDASEMSQSQSALESIVFTSDTALLPQSEKDGLVLMREEEKLAGDVYAYFYEKYALRPFTNINKSEVRHSDAVLKLLTYFGLEDPKINEAGKFKNQDIQALYNQLTAAGSTAELALATGAFIEEYDIADLRKLIAASQNDDIKAVYANLLNGSYNHIRAFTRVLAGRGITYSPKILTVAELNEILAK